MRDLVISASHVEIDTETGRTFWLTYKCLRLNMKAYWNNTRKRILSGLSVLVCCLSTWMTMTSSVMSTIRES